MYQDICQERQEHHHNKVPSKDLSKMVFDLCKFIFQKSVLKRPTSVGGGSVGTSKWCMYQS